ncbi:MAG: TonB-dependent receptor [Sulfurovum sp.]|nr:TonB-dependent receptor [Sulfurovum sp.]
MKKTLTLSLFASSLLTLQSHAREQVVQLKDIAVSASPVHQHQAYDVPAQVDTLSAEEISEKQSASLGKILEDIPGVNTVSTGSQAGKPVIRGMTGERVKVLSNGSSTDSQTYGIRHLHNIDPFLAERIEVIRGAQGVLYGSDALGGIVNVLSAKPLFAEDGQSLYKGEIVSEYHTNNQEWMNGIKAKAAEGKIGINLGLSTRSAENYKTPNHPTWKPGDPAGTLPRFSGELPFTNFENRSANLALGYEEEWGNIVLENTYWHSYQNYLGHTPGNATPPFEAISSAGQELSNNETQLRAEVIAGEWLIKPSISHTRNAREAATSTPYEEMESKKGTPDYLDLEVKRTDAKLAVIHPIWGIFDGEVGIEGYTKEQILREGKLAPSADEKGIALYLFEEADLEDFILQAGVRYDRRSIDAPLDGNNAQFSDVFDATNNSKDFGAFGGSLGLTYKATEHWNIAANLTRGFRAPSIFELYAGGIHGGVQAYQRGNPELEEETTLGADLSLRYKDETKQATLTFYHTSVQEYIYLENTGNTVNNLPEMQNQQTDARIQGIEFAFETHVAEATRLEGAFEIIRGEDTKNDRALPLMPAHNARLAVHHDLGSLWQLKNNTLSLDLKYVDAQKVGGSYEPFAQYNTMPFGSADTSGYTLWGLGYTNDFELFEKAGSFTIRANNLFDKAYRDFLDTYKGYALGMGRDISFSVSLKF